MRERTMETFFTKNKQTRSATCRLKYSTGIFGISQNENENSIVDAKH